MGKIDIKIPRTVLQSHRLEVAESIILRVARDLEGAGKVTTETHEILDAWLRAQRAWQTRHEE